jgi:hypothetical protein
VGRLVRHEDQAGALVPAPDAGEGTQEHSLIRGPGGARHHGRCPAPESKQGIGRIRPDHALEDAVEPRIAEHADPLGGHAQAGKAGRIIG